MAVAAAALTLILAVQDVPSAQPPLPGLTPCQWQAPFTVSFGPYETFLDRMVAADALYHSCHGGVGPDEAIGYLADEEGRLSRRAPGEPAGGRRYLSLYIQYRERGMATFWLTWFWDREHGEFCHFRRAAWTARELDETAEACFRAMQAGPPPR